MNNHINFSLVKRNYAITILAGLFSMLPYAIFYGYFQKLLWFGDEWDQINQIGQVGFFYEVAFLNTVFRSKLIASKIVLFKHLKEMLSRMVLFKMKVNQGFKMILEGHLQRPVALRFKLRHVDHGVLTGNY